MPEHDFEVARGGLGTS